MEANTKDGAVLSAFTKRHYILFASLIRDAKDKNELVEAMIAVFGADNPRFDEDKFREAAERD